MVECTPPSVFVLLVVSSLAATALGDSVPSAAILAATIFRIADVLSVAHSTASTYRLAIALYAVLTDKPGLGVVFPSLLSTGGQLNK